MTPHQKIIEQQREINNNLVDLCHAQVDMLARIGEAITALPGGRVYQQVMQSAFEDIITSLRTLIEQQKIVETQAHIITMEAIKRIQ